MSENDELLTEEQRQDLLRGRRSARLVGLVIPLVLTAAWVVVQILWLPRLPNPTAIHWGIAGDADGFGSPWMNVLGIAGVSVLLALLSLMQEIQSAQKPDAAVWSATNRAYPAILMGTVVSVQILILLLTIPQLDLADARDAAPSPWAAPLGFGVGIAAGLLAFLLQPRIRIDRPLERDSAPMPLADAERAVWFGEVKPSPTYAGVVGGTLLLMLGTAIMMLLAGSAAWWTVALLFLVLTALVAATSWFRVRIDETGIEARSALGWPRIHVPATDIDRVAAAEVAPFAEFGGWGLRWVPGGFGLVMRTGEGIVVTRRSGRVFTVTVDDAETGAALLAAVASET